MKKLKAFLKMIRDLFNINDCIDAGAIDFSGQGRNKYGK